MAKSKLLGKKTEVATIKSEEVLTNEEAAPTLGEQIVQSLTEAVGLTGTTEVKKEGPENPLDQLAYVILRDPEKPGHNYLSVEIKFNLKTKKTAMIVREFTNKHAAFQMLVAQDNTARLIKMNRGE